MSKEKRNTVKKTVTMHPKVVDKVREYANNLTEMEIAKEGNLRLQKFKLLVWFRYISNGEQEKDCDTFTTNAYTLEHAKMNITEAHFNTKSVMPFKFELIN